MAIATPEDLKKICEAMFWGCNNAGCAVRVMQRKREDVLALEADVTYSETASLEVGQRLGSVPPECVAVVEKYLQDEEKRAAGALARYNAGERW